VDPTNPSQLVLDPFLCDALFPPQPDGVAPLPTHLARSKVPPSLAPRLTALRLGSSPGPCLEPLRLMRAPARHRPRSSSSCGCSPISA
jgi:hypothetical protein